MRATTDVSGRNNASSANARRGEGITELPSPRTYNFDQFVTYLLDRPYVAEPGIYFATVAQLGQTGLELGGVNTKVSRRDLRVENLFEANKDVHGRSQRSEIRDQSSEVRVPGQRVQLS